MKGVIAKNLPLAATLGVVLAMAAPTAAEPPDPPLAHTNQDGPDSSHHNQDRRPWFELPDRGPPDRYDGSPGIGEDGRDQASAPFGGGFGGMDFGFIDLSPDGRGVAPDPALLDRASQFARDPLSVGMPVSVELLGSPSALRLPGDQPVGAIPTPGTLSLLGLAALAGAGRRRRRSTPT